MLDLILYVVLAIVGYIIASRLQEKREELDFIAGFQTWAILILVLFMGARMGANEEIITNLNKIGFYALIFTLIVVTFSVICVCGARHLTGLDRRGMVKTLQIEEADLPISDESEDQTDGGTMTFLIVLTVGLGMLLGYGVIRQDLLQYEALDTWAGYIIKGGLCLLLFLVGFDLGLEGVFVQDIKTAGLRVFAIPLAVAIGTLAGAAVCSMFLPVSLGQSLAVGAGFGWYSLAPVMIMEKGFITVSAISFMHNVMRELLALLLIPAVAKKIGHIEAVAMPGSGASDVCLPLIVKSTRGGIAIYSFVTGISVSILVPILVPLFLR